MLFKLST